MAKGVMTNTVPTDAYRGAGRPEAIYCVERLVDKCARELGLSAATVSERLAAVHDGLGEMRDRIRGAVASSEASASRLRERGIQVVDLSQVDDGIVTQLDSVTEVTGNCIQVNVVGDGPWKTLPNGAPW